MKEEVITAIIKCLYAYRSVDNPSLWNEFEFFCKENKLDPLIVQNAVSMGTAQIYDAIMDNDIFEHPFLENIEK